MGKKDKIRSVTITVRGTTGHIASCTWHRWGLVGGTHLSGDPSKPRVHVTRKRLKLRELLQARKMVKAAIERLDRTSNPEGNGEGTGKPGMELMFTFTDDRVTTIEWQPGSSSLDEKIQYLVDFLLEYRVGGW